MNIIRSINSSGDWNGWGTGRSAYISGNGQVAQNIGCRLRTILGECFFATNAGVNWYVFLGYPGQQASLQLAIASIIANTQDVVNIASASININTAARTFVVTYTVNTIYTNNFSSSAEISL